MLSLEEIKTLSQELYEAEHHRIVIEPLLSRYTEMTLRCAYQIQMENVNRRVSTGERIVGKKIGLTSVAMQKVLGVFEPDYGHIFHTMVLAANELSLGRVIQPKAEGEIAFVLKSKLEGPGVTPADVIQATDFVMPAIEIIDSRVRDWKIKIEDTVADNASSAFILLGNRSLPVSALDMFATGMVFCRNGEIVNTGAAAAVMESPVNALCWLVNKLSEFEVGLRAGEIVLTGALTGAVDIAEQDYIEVVFDRLGPVCLRVVP
jgi:2-keto-4-pentenoate hydratase